MPDHRPSLRRRGRPTALVAALLLVSGSASGAAAPTAAARMEHGLDDLARYEFAEAHLLFSSVRAAPDADAATRRRAAFALAVTCHQWQPAEPARIAEAEALYRELAQGGDEIAAQSLLRLGRIAELRDFYGDPEDLPGARAIYAEVMARWPGRPEAGEACLRLAGAHAQTLDPEEVRRGIAVIEERLRTHPGDPQAALLLQYAASLHWDILQDARAAVDCLVRADRIGFDAENREWSLCWRIARLAEERLGDRDLAVRYYTRIVTAYPKSGAAWDAQQQLRRLGVEPPPIRLFDPEALVRAEQRRASAPAKPAPRPAPAKEARP